MSFAGNKIAIICPFHEEVAPSCYIYLHDGSFHCFGCAKHGDIIDIVSAVCKVNRLKAMIMISKHMLHSNDEYDKKRKQNEQSLKSLKYAAWLQYKSATKPDWKTTNYRYLHERGFKTKTLKLFDVRLEIYTDWPILIPLKENGKFKGYVRRRIDSDEEKKYIYNKGFKKNTALIGNYQKNQPIMLVEGILDLMMAVQYGATNVVCILGWHPSTKQITKLKSITNYIIPAVDNTPLGKKGVELLAKDFKIIPFRYPTDTVKDVADMSIYQFNYAMEGYRFWLKSRRRV